MGNQYSKAVLTNIQTYIPLQYRDPKKIAIIATVPLTIGLTILYYTLRPKSIEQKSKENEVVEEEQVATRSFVEYDGEKPHTTPSETTIAEQTTLNVENDNDTPTPSKLDHFIVFAKLFKV
jgi:hypothetical protein